MIPQVDDVAGLVANDETSRQDAAVLFGYVGSTSTDTPSLFRVYRETFTSWYEVAADDILAQQPADSGRSLVWVKAAASITKGEVNTARAFADDEAQDIGSAAASYYPKR